jgi:hypothetical protein
MPPFNNTLSEQQIKNVAAYVTAKDHKSRLRGRCDVTPGPCARNDQGDDRREERRDARVCFNTTRAEESK